MQAPPVYWPNKKLAWSTRTCILLKPFNTSPTTRPATPTFDEFITSPAHGNVWLAPTPTAPQPPHFSTLDMQPHPPHLESPQAKPLAPLPLPEPPALKRTRPDSPPPASRQPQGAISTDAVSPKPLEAHNQGDEPGTAGSSTQLPTRAPGYFNLAYPPSGLFKHDQEQTPTPQ